MFSEHEYPILEYDDDREAIIDPYKIHAPVPGMPEHAVLCFFNNVVRDLAAAGSAKEIHVLISETGRHPVYILERPQGRIALMHPCIGGPFAVGLTEELIASGCRKIIACGGAGVLDSAVGVGQILVPESAVRDEGTSYHYLPPSRTVDASPEAVAAIEDVLVARGIPHQRVRTWTIDAFYRETPARIRRRREEGCLTVEMEAASLFALAQFRGVTLGQLLYAGDDVSGAEWDHRNWNEHHSVRERLLEVAIESCLRL